MKTRRFFHLIKGTVISVALLSGFVPGAAAPAGPTCVAAPSGIVAWWPGDGNANDIFGNNNGTLVGGATFAPGLVGQAFSLDGINSFVDAGNASNLKVSPGDFTVDAWVNFSALTHPSGSNNGRPLGDMSIVDKMGNAMITSDNSDGWRLMKQDDNHFWFCFADSLRVNGCGVSAATTVTSTTVATTGTWFHIAAVKSSSEIAIYVNGVKEGTKTLPLFYDTYIRRIKRPAIARRAAMQAALSVF